MTKESWVIGWLLDPGDRADLLDRIAPAYPQVIAHHVTLKSGAGPTAPTAQDPAVVGIADGGGTYHITWSLAPGRRAVESNAVIAEHGWAPIGPLPIRLIPARF